MYKNILEKFNFNMEEIKLFDSFAGIGALHQSLKELGVPVKLTGISEIDVDAIISYAAIHIDNFKDLDFTYPTDEEIKKYLMDRNIGYDFDKQKSRIPRMKKDKLKLCYKATILTNNMGDVGKLNFDDIPDSDLFNFSFPCTNVSNIGKQEGFTKEDGSVTHSGLYIYGIKAIKTKKFKYIMIENVKGLIQKKFVNDFYNIVKEIEGLGYNCYYPKKDNDSPTCLNAKDFGVPQNRERIFVICIRKDIDKDNFEFPIGKDYGIRLKDLLENQVNKKYYLSDNMFRYVLDIDENQQGTKWEGRANGDYINPIIAHTISVRGVISQRAGVSNIISISNSNPIKVEEYKTKLKNKSNNNDLRNITPLEAWRLMGFKDEHINKVKELGIFDSALYKQAGNSIVVNCPYFIFKEVFKKYINN